MPSFVLTQTTAGVSSGGGQSGALFITDVTSSDGIIGDKVYLPDTVPADTVIVSATTDSDNVTVHVYVEGSSSVFTPTVYVDGILVTNLQQVPNDVRSYTGSVDTIVSGSRNIEATSSGLSQVVFIERAGAGPEIIDMIFGTYPGSQTELKAGDVISVVVVIENSATTTEILNFGAGTFTNLTLDIDDSAQPGYKYATGNVVISNNTGTLSMRAQGTNSLGTPGNLFTSVQTLDLNQTYPSITYNSITYPVGQQAIKDSETVDVQATVNNFDTINYSGNNLSIPNSTVYDVIKTTTRTGGSYIVTGTNYTISATRSANNATTTQSTLVKIVNVAATAFVSINGNPVRLISSAIGEDYITEINPNQQLIESPSVDASIGTYQGSWSSSSGNNWNRTLTIYDTSGKGTGIFSNLALTGLSLIPSTTLTGDIDYIVGGFTSRNVTFPAFSQITAIGTAVADFNKTQTKYAGTIPLLDRRTDTNDVVDAFTIVDVNGNYDPFGEYLWINDVAFAGSNSSGTLQCTIEEVI